MNFNLFKNKNFTLFLLGQATFSLGTMGSLVTESTPIIVQF
ncbi:hypothetical protein [Oceanirhabdus seepicola]|nr:hypothetical protein [Oceanirhabdus seepicola]